ncbi:apoptosis-inducing factor 3 isoform X1 [Periplaneta americana]|uniref:apoptosis-inducing factor 3 isoform X1 n=3 Tax=Periplaneta americana TaxID=6978 RepID=UPI0037E786B3
MFLSTRVAAHRAKCFSPLRKLQNVTVHKPAPVGLCSVWQEGANQLSTTSSMGSSSSKTMKVTSRKDKMSSQNDDYVEAVVCQDSDIQENEMKAFELGDAGKILLVKQNGKLSAVGAKCTHYGAPLDTGVLGEGRVRCPWHGACFNVTTGDIEDFPGLDSLPCYQVEVQDGGGVKVRAKREHVKSNKRVKDMVKRDKTVVSTFVVVGGGAAGVCCVETLRQEGYKGRIVFVCKESVLPYDRIKLSKTLDMKADKISLRPATFYKEHDIEVLTSTEVVSLNTESKVLKLSSGNDLKYDAVFLGTGSIPRRPPIPGAELKNVFVLRTVEDANTIASQLSPEKNVVILGASFIGMEAAAYCVGKAKSVTVIGRDSVPFRPVLGEEIGARLMQMHKEKGVVFKMGAGVARFLAGSSSDAVNEVELTDGSTLPAEVCLLGIGSYPATKYLDGSGVNVDQNGAVVVNKHMESNIKGVYAGGDIAYAPVLNTAASIGHWQLAHYHGHIAALNMAGKLTELQAVPFFWTMLFGKGIRYAGYAPKFDDVVIAGSLEDLKFVAHYVHGDRVAAVATCGSDPVAAKFAEMLSQGKELLKSDLQPDPLAWTK